MKYGLIIYLFLIGIIYYEGSNIAEAFGIIAFLALCGALNSNKETASASVFVFISSIALSWANSN